MMTSPIPGRRRGGLLPGSNLISRHPALLLRARRKLHVRVTEDEHVSVLLVLRMKGECRDASAHIQKKIFLAGRIVRQEAVDPAFVLGHQKAGRRADPVR